LTFVIGNPVSNPLSLIGVAFTDALPAGLVVATPDGLTGSCSGGTITAAPGASTVSLSGAGLAPGASCTFSVNVTGVGAGVDTNAVSVTSSNGGPGNTALATLVVLAPPTFTKGFSPLTIFQSQTSTLTLIIANPNSIPVTGLTFTDPFPAGMAGVTLLSDTCGGTAAVTPGSLSLTGGTVAATSSCTITATVQALAGGLLVNTTSTLTSIAATAPAATATLAVFRTDDPTFQISYAADPSAGESYVNIINTGANGAPPLGPGLGGATGNTCVNVYAVDPSEELIACCSCLLTPNQVMNLGVNADLTIKTETGVVPPSVTIKLVNTLAGPTGTGTSCTNSATSAGGAGFPLAQGMIAYGTTPQAVGTVFNQVEHPFIPSTLSASELASLTGRCSSIIGNASGYGICLSCRSGALGATKQ
jgi:hypothetical protein